MTELTSDQLTRFRQRLEERRAELAAWSGQTEDQRAPVELDQGNIGRLSRLDAIQGQQMALEAERRRQRESARIEAALERMGEGEFGWCAKCGEPIGLARLEVDPTTPLCVACASG